MNVVHKVTADLSRRGVTSRVDVVQGDSYSRQLQLHLIAGGAPWTPPTDATVAVRYRKPGGVKGSYNTLPSGASAYTVNGNTVTVTLSPELVDVSGTVQIQVVLTKESESISLFTLEIHVHPDPSR